MPFDKTDTILGYRITLIRGLLRRVRYHIWTDETFAEDLETSIGEAARLADELVARGLLAPNTDIPGLSRAFALTAAGHRLCNDRDLDVISKRHADLLLAEVLERVEAINTRDELVFRVAEVHVFGSYYRGDSEVAAIELAVRLVPRRPDVDWATESSARALAQWRGRRRMTVTRQRSFGSDEVMKLIKQRNRYLSLYAFKEVQTLGTLSRRVWPPDADGPPDPDGPPGAQSPTTSSSSRPPPRGSPRRR
jgi:hypothetical protein